MNPLPPGHKPLIVCADDFAVHESASLGIARLAAQGRISATSAMVLSPRWVRDAALLQDLRGRIDVGLHLDWTSDFARAAGHGLGLRAAMRRPMMAGATPSALAAAVKPPRVATATKVSSCLSRLMAACRRRG